MSPENPLDDTFWVNDSSSLADPKDFNRDSCDFPVGLKKRSFPDIYPEYKNEDTPIKRSKSCSSHGSSSPTPSRESFVLTDRINALFDELAQMPTPSPYRPRNPTPSPSKFKFYPLLSPSSVTQSPSPLKSPSTKFQPTFEEYALLEKEKGDAMEKILDLQEKLDHSQRMQEVAEDKVAALETKLGNSLNEILRLQSFMKAEGERLIQAC